MAKPHSIDDHGETALRRLARSLLDEWLGAQELPGNPVSRRNAYRLRWSKSEIAQAVLAFHARMHRWPASREWQAPRMHGLPSRWTVAAHWGTMDALMTTLTMQEVPQ